LKTNKAAKRIREFKILWPPGRRVILRHIIVGTRKFTKNTINRDARTVPISLK